MNSCLAKACKCIAGGMSFGDCINADDKIICNDGGRHIMKSYHIFPGIELIYGEFHCQSACFCMEHDRSKLSRILEIIHCSEGRLECSLNNDYIFLSQGDLMIVKADAAAPMFNFPIKHYHGLMIRIDLDETPKCLSCIMDDITVKPEILADKFCKNGGGYVARANTYFEHIFSEIYSVPEEIRSGYYKIKTLELLLFLSVLNVENDEFSKRIYTRAQVSLAEDIGRYLSEHLDDRITIEQLAEEFHISAAHIKNTFKGVYGVPVGSYIRAVKMESAAYMLEYTDKTILEIAGEHGYDNASKFANAFRAVKGLNPAEYRNVQCKKICRCI